MLRAGVFLAPDGRTKGMVGQTSVSAGSEEFAASESGGATSTIVDCYGCGAPITTFSGERRFCVPCTKLIIEQDVARRDFAEGCLREAVSGQQTLEEWTIE